MQLNLTEEQKTRNQKIGKIVEDVLYFGFLTIIALGVLSFLVTGKTTGKPNLLGYRHFYIVSGSMEPTIRTQQFVVSKVINADDVQENDIIAYKSKESKDIIIHRVIDIKEEKNGEKLFVFQGDNNPAPDPYDVTKDMIMYKIILY